MVSPLPYFTVRIKTAGKSPLLCENTTLSGCFPGERKGKGLLPHMAEKPGKISFVADLKQIVEKEKTKSENRAKKRKGKIER